MLLDCRVWRADREELRATPGDKSRWGDMTYLLGCWSGRKTPGGKFIDEEAATSKLDMKAVKATIDFAIGSALNSE